MIDVGIATVNAGPPIVIGRHRVFGWQVRLERDLTGRNVALVIGQQILHDRGRHDAVQGSGEKPDSLPREVVCWIDRATADIRLRSLGQPLDARPAWRYLAGGKQRSGLRLPKKQADNTGIK